jgi:hypothetical protein
VTMATWPPRAAKHMPVVLQAGLHTGSEGGAGFTSRGSRSTGGRASRTALSQTSCVKGGTHSAFPAPPHSTVCCGSVPCYRRLACVRGQWTGHLPSHHSRTAVRNRPFFCALSALAAHAEPWAGDRVCGILPREAPAGSGRFRTQLPCRTTPGAARCPSVARWMAL